MVSFPFFRLIFYTLLNIIGLKRSKISIEIIKSGEECLLFGYIKPLKPELRIREAEEYRSIYCGLCAELKKYGVFSRMTLSYDFAFMALFFMAVDENSCPEFTHCRCIAHPLKKQCQCVNNDKISLSAKAAVILTYYKIKDDLSDNGFIKKTAAAFLLPFASSARKKALSSGGAAEFIDLAAKEMIESQKAVEKENCSSSDMAAQPTAVFLEKLMTLGSTEKNEKILRRFGYLLGRYIYLCDALDDLDDDRKKNNYNPFIFSGEEALSSAKAALFMTTAELSDDLELLELDRYKEIVENIVCLGLRSEVERIINKKGGNEDGKSL